MEGIASSTLYQIYHGLFIQFLVAQSILLNAENEGIEML